MITDIFFARMNQTFLRIGAVSYEGSVFGWDVACNSASAPSSSSPAKEDEPEIEGLDSNLVFGFHVSVGSMKAIAVSESGKYMICGGMDERIRIFDVGANRAIGELSGHTGCVTSLQFVGDKFIVSGSEDNNVAIWRVQDWMCVHILGGHKGSINDLAVHPSGKLALSVSKDNTMKLWNLVQGRCAFTRRLHGPADKVQWSNDGEMYLLVVGSELQIYAASDNNTCISSVKMGSRINQAKFVDIGIASTETKTQYVALICENKTFSIVDSTSKKYFTFSTSDFVGDGRPRDLFCCKPNTDLDSEEMSLALEDEGDSIVIVTSTGRMVVFSAKALVDLNQESESESSNDASNFEFAMLSSATISAEPRLTGVVAWLPYKSKSDKKMEIKKLQDENVGTKAKKSKKKEVEKEEEESNSKKVRFN